MFNLFKKKKQTENTIEISPVQQYRIDMAEKIIACIENNPDCFTAIREHATNFGLNKYLGDAVINNKENIVAFQSYISSPISAGTDVLSESQRKRLKEAVGKIMVRDAQKLLNDFDCGCDNKENIN